MTMTYSVSSTPAEVTQFLDSLNTWEESGLDFSTYLQEMINNPQETLSTLNECKCCSRHAICRPKMLGPWTNTIFHNNQDTSCQCSCRHTARWICRVFKGDRDTLDEVNLTYNPIPLQIKQDENISKEDPN